MKTTCFPRCILLCVWLAQALQAASIVYYQADFENGSLGGGQSFGAPFTSPTNIQVPELDGRGLDFQVGSQARWQLNGPFSNLQHVGFDFFSMSGANVTMFLDVPQILRTDISVEGSHRLDVFYDLSTRVIEPYLDGTLSPGLLTIAAWPSSLELRSVRISNQSLSPGNSTGVFKVDNFIWQGGVTSADVLQPKPVPDTGSTLSLSALVLLSALSSKIFLFARSSKKAL